MAVVLHEIPQSVPHGVDHKDDDTGNDDGVVLPVGDEVVEHHVCHDGIADADGRNDERRQHIQREKQLVRLIIMYKSLQHDGSSNIY